MAPIGPQKRCQWVLQVLRRAGAKIIDYAGEEVVKNLAKLALEWALARGFASIWRFW